MFLAGCNHKKFIQFVYYIRKLWISGGNTENTIVLYCVNCTAVNIENSEGISLPYSNDESGSCYADCVMNGMVSRLEDRHRQWLETYRTVFQNSYPRVGTNPTWGYFHMGTDRRHTVCMKRCFKSACYATIPRESNARFDYTQTVWHAILSALIWLMLCHASQRMDTESGKTVFAPNTTVDRDCADPKQGGNMHVRLVNKYHEKNNDLETMPKQRARVWMQDRETKTMREDSHVCILWHLSIGFFILFISVLPNSCNGVRVNMYLQSL